MAIVLARRRRGLPDAAPPAVHAYPLPDRGEVPAIWQAACGIELAAEAAERVPQFTGAPCSACLLLAFGDDANQDRAQVHVPARSELGTYPAYAPISPTGHYALVLWGERSVHFVADKAVRGQLDGRDVVQAICGHLGWGPLEASSTPRKWPVCSECLSAVSPRKIEQ